MARIAHVARIYARWTTTLAAAAAIALAASGSAAAAGPTQATSGVNQDLAKQHLTAARNALSDVTQLPAAAQLTGETRTEIQQLISNFNELITTGADWRRPHAKVRSNLAALLGPDVPPPASGTAGAVGTSGTGSTIDPAIRAMLVEFRAELDRFESAASATASPSPEAAAPPPAPTPTPTPAPTPAPTTPPVAVDDKPDSPPETAAATDEDQEVTVVARDLLLHVEAVEVILGAQTAAQKAATAAAGGAVVSTDTPSGSTRTTITGPDVTLNAGQLDQIRTHLKEIRRLLDKK